MNLKHWIESRESNLKPKIDPDGWLIELFAWFIVGMCIMGICALVLLTIAHNY